MLPLLLCYLYAQKNQRDTRGGFYRSLVDFCSIGCDRFMFDDFSQSILSIFGAEFVVASWELKILVLGQLIDVLCGSVGYLMIMTGHQNQSFMVSGCCVLINLVLNAIAIPLLGTLGAAIATAFTLIVWNIWMSILVVKHLQINPSIFSLFWQDKERSPTTLN